MEVFKDHPGLTGEDSRESGGKKRKGGGKTVSSFYKEQLTNLMSTLHATEPHFIRFGSTHLRVSWNSSIGIITDQSEKNNLNGVLQGNFTNHNLIRFL